MGYAKEHEKRDFPSFSLLPSSLCVCWRIGLSLGGLLPRDGLLLVYSISIRYA